MLLRTTRGTRVLTGPSVRRLDNCQLIDNYPQGNVSKSWLYWSLFDTQIKLIVQVLTNMLSVTKRIFSSYFVLKLIEGLGSKQPKPAMPLGPWTPLEVQAHPWNWHNSELWLRAQLITLPSPSFWSQRWIRSPPFALDRKMPSPSRWCRMQLPCVKEILWK